MQKKHALGIGCALAILLVIALRHRGEPEQAISSPSTAASRADAQNAPAAAVAVAQPAARVAQSRGPRSVAALAPSVETLRAEVTANPERPPSALVRFAAELAPRMQEALRSESSAVSFFDELSECVLSGAGTIPASARALCLANAQRVAGKFQSELGDRYSLLERQADPEVLRLM